MIEETEDIKYEYYTDIVKVFKYFQNLLNIYIGGFREYEIRIETQFCDNW